MGKSSRLLPRMNVKPKHREKDRAAKVERCAGDEGRGFRESLDKIGRR